MSSVPQLPQAVSNEDFVKRPEETQSSGRPSYQKLVNESPCPGTLSLPRGLPVGPNCSGSCVDPFSTPHRPIQLGRPKMVSLCLKTVPDPAEIQALLSGPSGLHSMSPPLMPCGSLAWNVRGTPKGRFSIVPGILPRIQAIVSHI